MSVTIAGVAVNTNANGTFTITKLTTTTFSLDGSTGNGAGTGGTATFAVILETADDHGLTDGCKINVYGVNGVTTADGVRYVLRIDGTHIALFSDSALTTAVAGSGAFGGVLPDKAILSASNATPIVIGSTAHGFANGDYVMISGVKGNGAANGLWIIANTAANTFEIKDIFSVNAAGSGTYAGGGIATRAGGWLGNGLSNVELILETLVMETAAGTRFIVMDEQLEPALNLDVGGQLVNSHDLYRGTRTSRRDNLVIFNELGVLNHESVDIVFGTRIEIACTSQGNRPGARDSDELTLGGSQFLTVFVAVVVQ